MIGAGETGPESESCVEHGVWTPVPEAPPGKLDAFTLKLKDVDPLEADRIKQAGAMSFHAIGCSGDFTDHEAQRSVAQAMVAQLRADTPATTPPGPASSFLFHLGDVVYKDDNPSDPEGADQGEMYDAQFYAAYAEYPRRIFAIAGNHDGKVSPKHGKSAIDHFILNFCAKKSDVSADNQTDRRRAMVQPYVYWRLDTPLAHVIGLYTNVANGGILDDPAQPDDGPQYHWLVAQLEALKEKESGQQRRAILLALHYPPYSGTTNFAQRGDPTLGPTNATRARPLGMILQRAFAESGMRPDAVLSAHAHLYQRLTYRYADGWEIPFLIVGSGGHAPVESMWKKCDGSAGQAQAVPYDAILPPGFALPGGDTVRVVAYEDQNFGFLRTTLAPGRLTGEFFAVGSGPGGTLSDSFALDLATHRLIESSASKLSATG